MPLSVSWQARKREDGPAASSRRIPRAIYQDALYAPILDEYERLAGLTDGSGYLAPVALELATRCRQLAALAISNFEIGLGCASAARCCFVPLPALSGARISASVFGTRVLPIKHLGCPARWRGHPRCLIL